MWAGLLDLIFPPRCLLCPGAGSPFCPGCAAALFDDPFAACPRCAADVGPYAACSACLGQSLGFDGAVRLGVYDGPLRDAVLRIKSPQNEPLGEHIGRQWGLRRRAAFDALAATCVVPIPLHWMRRLRRGYNHAQAVARGLASALDLPMRTDVRRVRATADQKGLSRDARRENVRGAFAASGLSGQRVLLVDDVLTTGATCAEAARAMKSAGAAAVFAAALARATDRVSHA